MADLLMWSLLLFVPLSALFAVYIWPRRRLDRDGWMKPFRSRKKQLRDEKKRYAHLNPGEKAQEMIRSYSEKGFTP